LYEKNKICQIEINNYSTKSIFLHTMDKKRKSQHESQLKEIIWATLLEETAELQAEFWLITINSVKLAGDLSYLDVFVSSLKNQDILCKTLAGYAQLCKEAINRKMPMRKTPIIRFRYDDTMEFTHKLIQDITSLPM